MENVQKFKERNQSIDCCRLIASIFVVFLHVRFPGTTGGVIGCLARFAVPAFFVFSGYFSFQASEGTLLRRLKHVLWLNVAATALYLLWGCFKAVYYCEGLLPYFSRSLLNAQAIAKWLVLQINPFAGHLWYLAALFVCYLVLWGYVRFRADRPADYRWLYTVGAGLAALHFVLGEFSSALGMAVPYQLPRNGLLLGLPMFCLGMFLREYQDRLTACFHLTTGKLLILALAGGLSGILEWRAFGESEMFLGTLFEVASLMLILSAHPKMAAPAGGAGRILSGFGFLSAVIYIIHPLFIEMYEMFCCPRVPASAAGLEAWLRPIIIACASFLAAIVCKCLLSLWKLSVSKIRQRPSTPAGPR